MSHCTTHSFEIICRVWKVGLADHMMHSVYNSTAIRYKVSYKVQSLTYCVRESVVRALDFYPGDPGSNPIRDVGFFQTMHHFLVKFVRRYFHKNSLSAILKTNLNRLEP